jgi:DNA-binding transcriptional MerR regulator
VQVATFKIGEFSRLTQLPVKTLRYYDEIGLFEAAEADARTRYRHYTAEQLPRLNRILALRDLGFTLAEIRSLVTETITADQLRGMLLLRRAELQLTHDETASRLTNVEIRLNQIEQESTMPDIHVLTKDVPAQTVVGAREIVESPDLVRERCMALNDQACAVIGSAELQVVGSSLALYYPSETGIDVEMAYPVKDGRHLPAQQPADAAIHILPAASVAFVVYGGSYDDFGAVGNLHVAVRDWLEGRGAMVGAPVRELYLQPPTSPDDRTGVMEIQYPLT